MDDVAVGLEQGKYGIKINVTSDSTPVEYIRLRWNIKFPENALFLGDAWERFYGDLQWSRCNASRPMPWYFLMNCDGVTSGFGVKVRPSAMILWTTYPYLLKKLTKIKVNPPGHLPIKFRESGGKIISYFEYSFPVSSIDSITLAYTAHPKHFSVKNSMWHLHKKQSNVILVR